MSKGFHNILDNEYSNKNNDIKKTNLLSTSVMLQHWSGLYDLSLWRVVWGSHWRPSSKATSYKVYCVQSPRVHIFMKIHTFTSKHTHKLNLHQHTCAIEDYVTHNIHTHKHTLVSVVFGMRLCACLQSRVWYDRHINWISRFVCCALWFPTCVSHMMCVCVSMFALP